MDKLVFLEDEKSVIWATEDDRDANKGWVVGPNGLSSYGSIGMSFEQLREAFALFRKHTGQSQAMNWIQFDAKSPPPKGDYWCEVPALKLRDGGCLCRALYWTGERWEGPGGEYEVSKFIPEMLPQLHGRGNDASERTSRGAIDDTIEHLLGDISALSESIAEDEARAKARKLRLKVCRVRANALHHMSKDWRDVAQKMTDDGDDWKLASALARIGDLESERDAAIAGEQRASKLFDLVSAERNELVRRTNSLERMVTSNERPEEAAARIMELESERDSMAIRIDRLSAELAKPEDKRLREVTEAMEGRAVMFDDIAERVRQELHELGRWIERAGKAERERNEALARATEAERHKGRRESQINELVARLNKFGAQCSALMATVRQYDAFCASSEQ